MSLDELRERPLGTRQAEGSGSGPKPPAPQKPDGEQAACHSTGSFAGFSGGGCRLALRCCVAPIKITKVTGVVTVTKTAINISCTTGRSEERRVGRVCQYV